MGCSARSRFGSTSLGPREVSRRPVGRGESARSGQSRTVARRGRGSGFSAPVECRAYPAGPPFAQGAVGGPFPFRGPPAESPRLRSNDLSMGPPSPAQWCRGAPRKGRRGSSKTMLRLSKSWSRWGWRCVRKGEEMVRWSARAEPRGRSQVMDVQK